MGPTRHILISGASIAGHTLAHWLVRHGFRATVVELAPRPREGGSPIDVRGPAVDVADRMGITAHLRRADIDTEGLSFVDTHGTERAALGLRAIRNASGSTEYELPRAELTRVLQEAAPDEVEYVFGDSLASLHEDDDGVDVRFRHGTARRFDLVIGADGTHSTVRRLAFGDESDFLHHRGYYAAVVPTDPQYGRPRWGVVYNSPGRMVCVYSPPGRSDALFLFRREQPLHYDRHDRLQQKELVHERFAGEGWKAPQLLESLAVADDFYFDSVSQVRMPRWSRGRVALVGDAAHGLPLFGDGSSKAMIGAYVLAGELAAAGGEHRQAFARYEDRHRRFVEANVNIRAASRLLIPDTAAAIRRRNQLTRLARLLPALSRFQRWTSRNAARTLPDYGGLPSRD